MNKKQDIYKIILWQKIFDRKKIIRDKNENALTTYSPKYKEYIHGY